MRTPQTFRNVMAGVEVTLGGCWNWTRSTTPNGYGQVVVAQKHYLAHRYIYEVLVGPVPPGMDLGHICHDEDESCPGGKNCPHRLCCNPAHLRPMDRLTNVRAGRSGQYLAQRTHCPAGHPYSGDNLYSNPNKINRICRACKRDRYHAGRP